MMETEKMRSLLATLAMGWECCELGEDGTCELWSGILGVGPMRVRDWQPDRDWQQCGMVIDKMRAMEWRLEIDYSPACPWVKYSKTSNGKYYWEMSDLAEGDFCAEVCEVATRALESEATDE